MYQLFTFLVGALLAVMISVNGSLSSTVGLYIEVAIVHLVGTIFAFFLLKLRGIKIHFDPRQPKWIYLGGAIGVLTTLFQTFSFGKISLTSISALGLLGETLTALVIDTFGLFHMQKHPFAEHTLIGLAFALVGIVMMLDHSVGSQFIAVFLSLSVGVVIVTARTVNARLASSIGSLPGSFINHLVGLPITVLIAFLLTSKADLTFAHMTSAPLWMYFGGTLGVLCVALNNTIVPHISAFELTLLSFLGQLGMGLVIDFITGAASNTASILGGSIIALGMILNMVLTHVQKNKVSV